MMKVTLVLLALLGLSQAYMLGHPATRFARTFKDMKKRHLMKKSMFDNDEKVDNKRQDGSYIYGTGGDESSYTCPLQKCSEQYWKYFWTETDATCGDVLLELQSCIADAYTSGEFCSCATWEGREVALMQATHAYFCMFMSGEFDGLDQDVKDVVSAAGLFFEHDISFSCEAKNELAYFMSLIGSIDLDSLPADLFWIKDLKEHAAAVKTVITAEINGCPVWQMHDRCEEEDPSDPYSLVCGPKQDEALERYAKCMKKNVQKKDQPECADLKAELDAVEEWSIQTAKTHLKRMCDLQKEYYDNKRVCITDASCPVASVVIAATKKKSHVSKKESELLSLLKKVLNAKK